MYEKEKRRCTQTSRPMCMLKESFDNLEKFTSLVFSQDFWMRRLIPLLYSNVNMKLEPAAGFLNKTKKNHYQLMLLPRLCTVYDVYYIVLVAACVGL